MNDKASFELRAQMLEDRISQIADILDIEKDVAFMRHVYALLFNTGFDEPEFDADVVDGSGDKQVDILRIDEAEGLATIHIIQVKNSSKYKGTVVVQMRDALEKILRWPEEKFKTLDNHDLVMKISEVRELSARMFLKNIRIVVHYVGKGNTSKLSPDFEKEIEETLSIYKASREFYDFEFKVWGVNELIDRSYELEQQSHRIDETLPIHYTWQIPTYAEYGVERVRALICTVSGEHLAKLVDKHKDSIFEENVRTYLGSRKKINSEIYATCTDDNESSYFWFFNNGITVTCDDFDVAYNANPPCVSIKNMQIVNGCQTSVTLAAAWHENKLSSNTMVLLRIYATNDPDFVDRITLTTNSQNAVSNRDLRSNDRLQRDLEKLFNHRGYHYERKPGTYSKLKTKAEKQRVISNERVGQAYLAIAEHLPATAMSRKAEIWGEQYHRIYSSRFEELLASYLIYDFCLRRKVSISRENEYTLKDAISKYGTFHISRILGSYRLGERWAQISKDKLDQFINEIVIKPQNLMGDYEDAFALLERVVESIISDDLTRLVNVLKSSDIQKEIDEALQ
ncbi:MAG: AIPR protein [Chloroflexi bacterium ADurb.Bin360]|nr:MAG: AIPR protein [Chloroflexi bacterium ADurb.Bin360]